MNKPVLATLGLVLIATLVAIALTSLLRDGGEELAPLVSDRDPRSPAAAEAPLAVEDVTPLRPAPVEPRPEDLAPVPEDDGTTVTALFGRILTPAANPAAHATVRIFRQVDAGPLRRSRGRQAHEPVQTGADGTYGFEGLKGGARYIVRAEHPDYPPAERSDLLAVRDASIEVPDLEFVVGAEIRGHIERPGGKPLAGARIQAFDPLREPSSRGVAREPAALVVSDEQGAFVLSRLLPSVYELEIAAPGFETRTVPNVNVSAPRDARSIDVQLTPGHVVAGRIQDEAGEPVAGVLVEAEQTRKDQRHFGATTSRSDGMYRVDGLGAGEYRVTFSAKGFGTLVRTRVPADTENLSVRMKRNPGISGFITADDGKNPVGAFGVLIHSASAAGHPGSPVGEMRLFRSQDGSFTLDDLPPGSYLLRVYANGFAPTWSEPIRLDRLWVNGITVRMTPGAILSGSVVDLDGAPAANATVRLLDNSWRPMANAALLFGKYAQLGSTRTDADGRFQFADLAEGRYQVEIRKAERMPILARDLEVGAGGTIECGPFRFRAGGTIRGTILDDHGGPAGGARVLVIEAGQNGTWESTADAEGRFVVENLPPGVYSLTPLPPAGDVAGSSPFSALALTLYAQQTVTVSEGGVEQVILPMKTSR